MNIAGIWPPAGLALGALLLAPEAGCTVSAGVSNVPTGEESMNGLVATAEVALSMAKRAGRNQVIAA